MRGLSQVDKWALPSCGVIVPVIGKSLFKILTIGSSLQAELGDFGVFHETFSYDYIFDFRRIVENARLLI